jgi:glycine/D-amino acid oxidase-like deaminating enzyme
LRLLRPPIHPETVIVVGAGIVGLACAWWLQRRGHQVLVLDPVPAGGVDPGRIRRSASQAALGVLMADTFHRDRGRAWNLRQRSRRLWQLWRGDLARRGQPIPHRPGVLMLAAEPAEVERLAALAAAKGRLGLPLELWDRERLASLLPSLPQPSLAGLHSPRDGQLDPAAALAAFAADGRQRGMAIREEAAVGLEARGGGWRLALAGGGHEDAAWVVLATGAEGEELLAGLPGREAAGARLEPVLGQALELELEAPLPDLWPGAVVWRGLNLVPRPDLEGGRRLWLGATLEPGRTAAADRLSDLRHLGGAAPDWLAAARVVRHWQGLRPRPLGRPAPLLERPAPGVLLAGGHYRNGVLLAPASAAWVAGCIEGGRTGGADQTGTPRAS